MIKPFEYFIKENLVRSSVKNISMAKSLIEKAEVRFKRIDKSKIEEDEASIAFEEIYECLREASQSLMEISGYKPYSHEAVTSFLLERNLLSKEKVHTIDNYRVLRNNSVYKAEKISLQKCQEAKEFAKDTLPELNKKLNELIKKSEIATKSQE